MIALLEELESWWCTSNKFLVLSDIWRVSKEIFNVVQTLMTVFFCVYLFLLQDLMHHIGLYMARGRGAKVVSEVSFTTQSWIMVSLLLQVHGFLGCGLSFCFYVILIEFLYYIISIVLAFNHTIQNPFFWTPSINKFLYVYERKNIVDFMACSY